MAEVLGSNATAGGVRSETEWDRVAEAYPREGWKDGIVGKTCGFCRDKPATIFDNFVVDLGEEFKDDHVRKPNFFFEAFVVMES